MSFSSFNLPASILENLEALGYQAPTPIQQQSLPPALAGQDLIGLAQTGTGKTAAFVLPILKRLLEVKSSGSGKVRALVIAPIRELALQIHGEFAKLGKGSRLRGIPVYGGIGIRLEIPRLRQGVDIIIACPGRLLDHMERRTVDLSQVEILVLDEADHMFDMGFIDNIRKILKKVPSQRQTLLFSATMPKEVMQLAKEILVNPTTVQVGNISPAQTVTQSFYPVSEVLKSGLLIKLLQTTQVQSTLIFTRTKHRATQLAEQLEAQGFMADAFQGNLTQSKRQAILNRFRTGQLPILVATDIAARGIDVASVSHVINFDMPNTVEAYTHRIGRTGRASKTGTAFTFITRADMPRVRAIERSFNRKVESKYLTDFDYKAPMLPEFRMQAENPSPTSRSRTAYRHDNHQGEWKQRKAFGNKQPAFLSRTEGKSRYSR